MKEKYLFVYDTMVKAVNDLNSKKISVEHAKAANIYTVLPQTILRERLNYQT